MTSDHRLSERVYTALKSDILNAELAYGRLNTATLTDRYGTSATPVREAVLRLVGEGLLDMPATGGFVFRAPDVATIRDIYAFSLSLMLVIVARRRTDAAPLSATPQAASGLVIPIDSFFTGLARETGSPLLLKAVVSLNERMHCLRRAEQAVLKGLEREYGRLVLRSRESSTTALRREITAYYRRRLQNASRVLAASLAHQNDLTRILTRGETI